MTIDLTTSESAIWERMPEEDREVVLAGFGATLRWWARMHPVEETPRIVKAIRTASEPPPPLPDEFVEEDPRCSA